MKAIVQDTYGTADVLRLSDIERPAIGPDEVLLRVHAAGVDRGVWHLMMGLPYPVRLGFGFFAPRGRVRGMDVAGRVEALGKNVKGLALGDEVFGACQGAFAEYACARADRLAPKPARLSFARAAAVPVSACTALQGLRDAGRVQPGQKVLIVGAAGGVGAFAVQIAKAFGAVVTGVCSTAKTSLVRSLGADEVIDYTQCDFADGSRHYDLILDTGGNRPLSELRRALTAEGTLVIIGGEGGGRWLGGMGRQLQMLFLSPFVKHRLRSPLCLVNKADLLVVADLITSGKVNPVVEREYPLREAQDAIRHLDDRQAMGKAVITLLAA